MNSKKITSRKPLRHPLEFQQLSVIDKVEEAGPIISVVNEISTSHESKMNLRKRKASELEQVEDNLFEEDMSQKEKDELSIVLELSRISSKREADQRSKPKPVENLTQSKINDDSDRVLELSRISSKREADQRSNHKPVENLTQSKINDDSGHSSLDEDNQLSGSQSLFDSSKEDDNSNNTQLSQSLIHKNDDDDVANTLISRTKNRLQITKHKIDKQLSPELPSKVRRISSSSDSSRTHSPVFGLGTSTKNSIPEKRLINLRRENLQVIMKWGLFYPPPGVDLNSYTAHIISLLNNYEINLRKFQLQSFNKLDWPKAVVNGPHYPNTIDLRRRGDKPSIQITDDDSDNEFEQPKNEIADYRLRTKTQENCQSIEAVKLDDTELPDIVVENSPNKIALSSSPDSVSLNKTQEVIPEQPLTESLMNFLGKAFEIDNKDWLCSQESDCQKSESKLHYNNSNDKENCSSVEVLKEDIPPPVPVNSPVMERCNKLIEKDMKETSPNRTPSPESSQMFKHQEETLNTSEHENSEIRKSLKFHEEEEKIWHKEAVIACPLCNNMYTLNKIEEHAAGCEGAIEIRVSQRETKSLRRRGLPMERILQEIHSVSSDDLDNSSQETSGIRVKNQKSFSLATNSEKMKKLFGIRQEKIDESLEKCYMCGGFFPEGEPYEKHVKECVSSKSTSGESFNQLESPRSKNNILLLKQLESDSDEDFPPLVKKKARSGISFSQPTISTSDSSEINISGLKISNSPVKSFQAISNQHDNLIEFKKQFKSQQMQKEGQQANYGRRKKNIKRVLPKNKQKF